MFTEVVFKRRSRKVGHLFTNKFVPSVSFNKKTTSKNQILLYSVV